MRISRIFFLCSRETGKRSIHCLSAFRIMTRERDVRSWTLWCACISPGFWRKLGNILRGAGWSLCRSSCRKRRRGFRESAYHRGMKLWWGMNESLSSYTALICLPSVFVDEEGSPVRVRTALSWYACRAGFYFVFVICFPLRLTAKTMSRKAKAMTIHTVNTAGLCVLNLS